MKTKHQNPYPRGKVYSQLFDWMMQRSQPPGPRSFTRSEAINEAMNMGKSANAASATVNVLLSPRIASARGDCRGNMSAMGHIYYIDVLPRRQIKVKMLDKEGKEIEKTKNEEKRFRVEFRETPLEKNKRLQAKPSEPVQATSETTAEQPPPPPAEPVQQAETVTAEAPEAAPEPQTQETPQATVEVTPQTQETPALQPETNGGETPLI